MGRNLVFTSAFATLLASGTSWAASTGDEIRSQLVGNTFQGGMGGAGYASYFGPDGVYKDKDGGGKYTIEGDAVCYPGTEFGCYQAEITGNSLEWLKDGNSEGKGILLKGNPLGF